MRASGLDHSAALIDRPEASPAEARHQATPAAPLATREIGHDGAALERPFVNLFREAQPTPPGEIILDLDATDDRCQASGSPLLHGYDDCYCYLPLYVLCGRHLLAAQLRRANRDAAGGAVAEVARMVLQIRARWPRISIVLRADAGFARDELMAWCEANAVDYVFALARAQGPVGAIAEELAAAEAESLAQGRPARRFADLPRRTLDSWQRERRVVAKAEHLAKGANPRFIVTLLAARASDARAFYKDLYCARGEVENRIKACLAPRGDPGGRPGAASSSICSPTAPLPPRCAPTGS